jgi:hypothetical protein
VSMNDDERGLAIFSSLFGIFSLGVFVWFGWSLEGRSLGCRNGILPVSILYFASALFLFDRMRGKRGSFGPTGIDANSPAAVRWIAFIAALTGWGWSGFWMFNC